MNPTVIGSFTIFVYLSSTLLIVKERNALSRKPLPLWLALFAAGAHGAYLFKTSLQSGHFIFNFFNSASLISLIIVLLLLTASIKLRVEKLGIILFPISALMLGLELSIPEESHLQPNYNWQMDLHILSSIIAYSLLNIAAVQAILLAVQDSQLRSHHPQSLIRSLPPLQTMESLLFQMITIGLLFLSISLGSGFLFIEDLFAQHLVHKTVLSILAWIVFSALLIGRLRYGWRGQTAIRWTLIGFLFLLLAYFGSKLVLEIILDKV